MTEPEQRESRRLSSKNNKHRQQYMEHICKHLEAHNVFKRVGELSWASQEGTFTATQMEEYNKIDDSITDGMISAEKSLPRQRERGWTAEINTLIHRIRYYRLLLRHNRGLPTHDSIMRKVRELVGVTWDG